MPKASDPRLHHPHVARNREPILAVLRRVLPPRGLVLEVASGSGEHAAHFAKSLAPLRLDTTVVPWPVARADALVCINMIHITPWAVAEALMAGAERTLPAGALLYLYGPYQIDGRHTAASNQEFDAWLQAQNPEWGVRDLGAVTDLAARHGLALAETVPMPANNLSVIFRRGV
jgi:Protein of unknown function (DUF938)